MLHEVYDSSHTHEAVKHATWMVDPSDKLKVLVRCIPRSHKANKVGRRWSGVFIFLKTVGGTEKWNAALD